MSLVKYFCLSQIVLLLSLGLFIYIHLPDDKINKYHSNKGKVISTSLEYFDFIIVGAGSAGCVLANRLSKNKNVTLLLLEAGGSHKDIRIKVPIAFSQNFETSHDWAYNSIPQENKGNHSIFLPRGKTLGGSSSINGMIYIRGSAYDYDEWAKMGFNEGVMTTYFHIIKNPKSSKETKTPLTITFMDLMENG